MITDIVLWSLAVLIFAALPWGILWPRWLARNSIALLRLRALERLPRGLELLDKLMPIVAAGWAIAALVPVWLYLSGGFPIYLSTVVVFAVAASLLPVSFSYMVRKTLMLLRGDQTGSHHANRRSR